MRNRKPSYKSVALSLWASLFQRAGKARLRPLEADVKLDDTVVSRFEPSCGEPINANLNVSHAFGDILKMTLNDSGERIWQLSLIYLCLLAPFREVRYRFGSCRGQPHQLMTNLEYYE